jgi:hypothetical protein
MYSDLSKVMTGRMEHGSATVHYPVAAVNAPESDGSGLTPVIEPTNLCWSANPIVGYNTLHNVHADNEKAHQLARTMGMNPFARVGY